MRLVKSKKLWNERYDFVDDYMELLWKMCGKRDEYTASVFFIDNEKIIDLVDTCAEEKQDENK